jgi:hypothetical protein
MMKKAHLILLIITLVMASFSAYSLAAINQVYTVDYEWYSEYHNKYMSNARDTNKYEGNAKALSVRIEFDVVGTRNIAKKRGLSGLYLPEIINNDTGRYLYLFASIEGVASPEYRIKFTQIAQRGNVVEIILSINSPADEKTSQTGPKLFYNPKDIIRVDKNAFPIKGKLYLVFKNQYGEHLFENYYDL